MWVCDMNVEPFKGCDRAATGAGSTRGVALLTNSRETECGAGQFLIRFAVRAAPFAVLRNSRKTECGAGQFLIRFAVRAAPFALPAGRGPAFRSFLHAFHLYVAHSWYV